MRFGVSNRPDCIVILSTWYKKTRSVLSNYLRDDVEALRQVTGKSLKIWSL